jgi:hypothetical protein
MTIKELNEQKKYELKLKEQRNYELKKLEFEKSLELRNFEIDNFWKRGWFFGALLLALGAGYFQLLHSQNDGYCIYIGFLGVLVSTSQSLMNRGSKYWQERWENKTKNRESALEIDVTLTRRYAKEKYLIDASTMAKNENGLTVARRFSVSKLAILVWDLITLFWVGAWITQWHLDLSLPYSMINANALFFHGIILLYIFLFFFMRKESPLKKGSSETVRWFNFFPNGNGGKVYERFTVSHHEGHEVNTDVRYYDDSELYVTDKKELINKL